MRVLHLTDRITDRGGAHAHLLGILDALRHDHDLFVAAGCDEGCFPHPCPVALVPGLAARDRRTGATSPLDDLTEAFRPDVIHVHTVVNPAVLEWVANRPSVITVQDHRYFCPSRGKWTAEGRICRDPMALDVCAGCFDDPAYFREIYALTAERLAALRRLRIVVLSRYMKQELTALGIEAGRIAVVAPFVHGLEPGAEADGPPCVLFVGRLVETKGVDDAVEAWRLSGVDLPLVFAGTGPLRAGLEARGFEVLGWVPRPQLSAVYRRARALILPSRWQEPFGIAGLEAMSLGVPVVAWDSGGVGEWNPGPGLVPWGDVKALARGLLDAVRQPQPAIAGHIPDREVLMSRLLAIYDAARTDGNDVLTATRSVPEGSTGSCP